MAHPQPTAADSTGTLRHKSALFCQDCGHESPVDGDWEVQTQSDHRLYVCPECQHVLTARPQSDGSATPVARVTGALVRFWFTPAIYWCIKDNSCTVDPDAGAESACCA
jgi:hypothetical protein